MSNSRMVIGVTGQSGGGKTLVASLLTKRYGFNVIDADIVARQVVERGKPALTELFEEFGSSIIRGEGTLNRAQLASIVFKDAQKKKKMEDIIFPHILNEINQQIKAITHYANSVVFIDAPTLFESGGEKLCDKVVSVIAPRNIRVERLLLRDKITPEQVQARLSSQMEDDFYISRSDFVINNDGNLQGIENQIIAMLNKFGIKT